MQRVLWILRALRPRPEHATHAACLCFIEAGHLRGMKAGVTLLVHISAEILFSSMQRRHEQQLLMHITHSGNVHMVVQRPGWATVCLLAIVIMCAASLEWWHCWTSRGKVRTLIMQCSTSVDGRCTRPPAQYNLNFCPDRLAKLLALM